MSLVYNCKDKREKNDEHERTVRQARISGGKPKAKASFARIVHLIVGPSCSKTGFQRESWWSGKYIQKGRPLLAWLKWTFASTVWLWFHLRSRHPRLCQVFEPKRLLARRSILELLEISDVLAQTRVFQTSSEAHMCWNRGDAFTERDSRWTGSKWRLCQLLRFLVTLKINQPIAKCDLLFFSHTHFYHF